MIINSRRATAQSSTSVNFISTLLLLLQCLNTAYDEECFRDSCNYSVSTKLLIFIFDAYVHAKNENVHFRYILFHASVKYFKFVFLWKLNLHNYTHMLLVFRTFLCLFPVCSHRVVYLHIYYISTDWVMGCNESKCVAWASLSYAKPKNL